MSPPRTLQHYFPCNWHGVTSAAAARPASGTSRAHGDQRRPGPDRTGQPRNPDERDNANSHDRHPRGRGPDDPKAGSVPVPGDLSGGGELGAPREPARDPQPGGQAPVPARRCAGAAREQVAAEGAMTGDLIRITLQPTATGGHPAARGARSLERWPRPGVGNVPDGDHRQDRAVGRVQDSSSCTTAGRASVAAAQAGELAQCCRCGAVGTHYLTCPSLRLPAGYRLSQDPAAQGAGHRGERGTTYRPSLVSGRYREGPPGGPDHPDWPRRPQC
jgi:hypothetical protein